MTAIADPPVTSSDARKILWAEDDPADVRGTSDMVRYKGHTVVEAVNFEESAHALGTDAFDLFVVDGQLPKHGRTCFEAGSQLVAALRRGEFGAINRKVPFLIVTASEEWVHNADFDVTLDDGYLGTELKGGNVTDWFETELTTVPMNTHRAVALEEPPEATLPAERLTASPVDSVVVRQEQWNGVVTSLDGTHITAVLTDAEGGRPDQEARLPRELIASEDDAWIEVGVEFTYEVELRKDSVGPVVSGRLTILKAPGPTDDQVAAALERARMRSEATDDANA